MITPIFDDRRQLIALDTPMGRFERTRELGRGTFSGVALFSNGTRAFAVAFPHLYVIDDYTSYQEQVRIEGLNNEMIMDLQCKYQGLIKRYGEGSALYISEMDDANQSGEPFLIMPFFGEGKLMKDVNINAGMYLGLPGFYLALLHAVQRLHKLGYGHFDIKYNNVIWSQIHPLEPELIDFGFCRAFSDKPVSDRWNSNPGNLYAPETIVRHSGDNSRFVPAPSSDIFQVARSIEFILGNSDFALMHNLKRKCAKVDVSLADKKYDNLIFELIDNNTLSVQNLRDLYMLNDYLMQIKEQVVTKCAELYGNRFTAAESNKVLAYVLGDQKESYKNRVRCFESLMLKVCDAAKILPADRNDFIMHFCDRINYLIAPPWDLLDEYYVSRIMPAEMQGLMIDENSSLAETFALIRRSIHDNPAKRPSMEELLEVLETQVTNQMVAGCKFLAQKITKYEAMGISTGCIGLSDRFMSAVEQYEYVRNYIKNIPEDHDIDPVVMLFNARTSLAQEVGYLAETMNKRIVNPEINLAEMATICEMLTFCSRGFATGEANVLMPGDLMYDRTRPDNVAVTPGEEDDERQLSFS